MSSSGLTQAQRDKLDANFQDPKVALVASEDAAMIAALAAMTPQQVVELLRQRDSDTVLARALVAMAKALEP